MQLAQQSHDLLPEVQEADFSNIGNACGLHRVVCKMVPLCMTPFKTVRPF